MEGWRKSGDLKWVLGVKEPQEKKENNTIYCLYSFKSALIN